LCETEASIGVLPLEDNFYSRALTSPAKLGDYQGNGLPVIASRLPTTEYLLNENEDSLFYTPGDVQGLARAITSLFSDKERFIRLAKGSAQSASLRSWKDRSHRLIEFAKSGHVDVSSE
jgi:glycosyltransferase involved in cell wall biosynthesis